MAFPGYRVTIFGTAPVIRTRMGQDAARRATAARILAVSGVRAQQIV